MPLTIGTPLVEFSSGAMSGNNTAIYFPLHHTKKGQVVVYTGGRLSLITKQSDMNLDHFRFRPQKMKPPRDVLAVLKDQLIEWAESVAKQAKFTITRGEKAYQTGSDTWHYVVIEQHGIPIVGLHVPTDMVVHENYFED